MAIPLSSDIIAAIATAPGEAAISVVRISGKGCLALLDQLTRPRPVRGPLSACAPGTFHLAEIHHPETGQLLDEALVLLFRAPHSYTGEDSVEIHGHGGFQAAQRVLEAVYAAGASPAPPGEFTRRAFLNGKLDLAQAEAVLDLIHARGERSARLAASQLTGRLGERIRGLCSELIGVAADVEAMLDFPDDEVPPTLPEDVSLRIERVRQDIRRLLATWQEGRLLRDGAKVVIAGPPNAGKSTLFNRLSGYERAIVSTTPGTTRDLLEEAVVLNGIPVTLRDTAGIHAAENPIEQEGIRRAHHALQEADLILALVDGSVEPDVSFLENIPPEKSILILNKMDLGQRVRPADFPTRKCIAVSLFDAEQLPALVEAIHDALLHTGGAGAAYTESSDIAISSRHKALLDAAQRELAEAAAQLADGEEAAFVTAAEHLRDATAQLGQILGEDVDEATLDAIFSRFCVGK